MFNVPIESIDYPKSRVSLNPESGKVLFLDFNVAFPAHLENTLAAFANTFGGLVLIGVDETPTDAAALPLKGLKLGPGLRERVLQKGLDTIYPPQVLPEVHIFEFKSDASLRDSDRAIVVVRIAESDAAPHPAGVEPAICTIFCNLQILKTIKMAQIA